MSDSDDAKRTRLSELEGELASLQTLHDLAMSAFKFDEANALQRLIDEFSTLIFPAVDGLAGRETIVDYEGADGERPGAGQSLRLIGCETLEGGMVWLRHRVEEAPAPTPQG